MAIIIIFTKTMAASPSQFFFLICLIGARTLSNLMAKRIIE